MHNRRRICRHTQILSGRPTSSQGSSQPYPNSQVLSGLHLSELAVFRILSPQDLYRQLCHWLAFREARCFGHIVKRAPVSSLSSPGELYRTCVLAVSYAPMTCRGGTTLPVTRVSRSTDYHQARRPRYCIGGCAFPGKCLSILQPGCSDDA